jgi:hypothetical protein
VTTSQSLRRHAPPSKTILGDLPEADLHLALRRPRSEYWCTTPWQMIVDGAEERQLKGPIDVLAPYS